MEMIPWKYNGEVFVPPEEFTPEIWYGFVYMIYSLRPDGKKYIGKKFFWKQKILPITKTRKRRKRLKVESDWKTYWGSNKHLVADIEKFGQLMWRRQILHLCKTKGECAYMETKEQFDRNVLLTEEYYNGIINCRIGANAVKNLK
jgi:hypothetical protein|tara:strand:- start:1940 stop:2374 length:435 start_codon:yes stop_codon:yes gene_type:complete